METNLREPGKVADFPAAGASPSVPPPPEFGMVLDAPPPRDPTPVIITTTQPAPSRRSPWIVTVAAFAVAAGVIGFVIGDLDDGPSEPSSDSTHPHAVAVADADQAPVAPTDQPPATTPAAKTGAPAVAGVDPTAVVNEGPCPEGMMLITGGKFFMGTDDDSAVLAPARPAHQVDVGTLCIGVHEVTVDEYRQCSDRGECKRAHRTSEWPAPEGTEPTEWRASISAYDELCNERYDDRGDHPVNCVSWAQAQSYCEWRGGRLPTEAEWEFAARGSDGRVYPWGDETPGPEHMNGCGAECRTWRAARSLVQTPAVLYDASDGYSGTAPVGSFPAGRTQWGLEDIAGNVFEWTADSFAPYPGADPSPSPNDGVERRVIRGGAFNSFQAEHADPALRFGQAQTAHTHGIGFRCTAAPR